MKNYSPSRAERSSQSTLHYQGGLPIPLPKCLASDRENYTPIKIGDLRTRSRIAGLTSRSTITPSSRPRSSIHRHAVDPQNSNRR